MESRWPPLTAPAALAKVTVTIKNPPTSLHACCDMLDVLAAEIAKAAKQVVVAVGGKPVTGKAKVDNVNVPTLSRDYWCAPMVS